MKLVRDPVVAQAPADRETPPSPRHAWKLLVVDDEPDVRALTRLNLKGFIYQDRELEILEAASAQEAREVLAAHPDIAVALVDVVMETDDAGLRLVRDIRGPLANPLLRIVIRTGQPGAAPERYVIDHYDIDDYKDKTELTATRLYTTVRSALKAYRDLRTIDLNRQGLARVLRAAPDIYRIGNISLDEFFQGVLTQIIGLCNLSETSFISTIDGLIATFDGQDITIQATAGGIAETPRFREIRDECIHVVMSGDTSSKLRRNAFVLPLSLAESPVGFIYVEPTRPLGESDRNLIQVMSQQCTHALENLRLHVDLRVAYDHAMEMLAEVAEFKDKSTGTHINRIQAYTTRVARAMGVAEDLSHAYGQASRLHDVGKVGIPDEILRKKGRLTPEEYEIIKGHTRIGASILKHDKALALAREVALHHHERWDGQGYPDGVPSRQLPLVTRIVSVVDVFDALISRRPYKDPWEVEKALVTLEQGACSQFDPEVVAAFVAMVRRGELDELLASARREAGQPVGM